MIFHKRREMKMTQLELSRRVDMSRVGIANIETGVSSPSLKTAFLIADVLDIKWEDIEKECK